MMRTLRWLWPPAAPSLRALPEALLRAALFGVVTGLPFSFVFAPMQAWRYFPQDPSGWFLRATGFGVTLSVCFYLACGLPVSYILRTDTTSRRSSLVVSVTLVGALLGGVTALTILGVTRATVELATIGAALAVLLTVTLSAWYRLRADKLVADARARNWSLQAQINPHFFFNTLNTIAALIRPNPDAAERTIGLLADMSRYSFANESRIVPLEHELDFARKYLQIERERFGERLSWILPAVEDAHGVSLPPLTLQPLIENAVRHGIARRIDGGTISITLERVGSNAVLSVSSPVDEAPVLSNLFRPGHALWNTRERLQLTYGSRALLSVTAEDKTVTARISIPTT